MKYTFVRLPTGNIEIEHIREMYAELRYNNFIFKKWFPRPALIDKNGKTSWLYKGQNFDPKLIELVQDGWTHDHCQICSTTISNVDNESDDLEEFINKSEKVEKEY
ncbi:MAG: hypothetical protein JSR97_02030 [Verrucomicrobia bacterium]|nr:hypothetical protein [Verrucomicrobiota bacterium]